MVRRERQLVVVLQDELDERRLRRGVGVREEADGRVGARRVEDRVAELERRHGLGGAVREADRGGRREAGHVGGVGATGRGVTHPLLVVRQAVAVIAEIRVVDAIAAEREEAATLRLREVAEERAVGAVVVDAQRRERRFRREALRLDDGRGVAAAAGVVLARRALEDRIDQRAGRHGLGRERRVEGRVRRR